MTPEQLIEFIEHQQGEYAYAYEETKKQYDVSQNPVARHPLIVKMEALRERESALRDLLKSIKENFGTS